MGSLVSNGMPSATNDGLILNVASGVLGNADTKYTYFDLGNEGYKYCMIQFLITATTLTLEASNIELLGGRIITGTATSTDGTGATLVCSTLNSVNGFTTNSDLTGITVVITADATTPSNIGKKAIVTNYTGASGTMAITGLNNATIGAITSGVTQFRLVDTSDPWLRRVSDPAASGWVDVTTILTGAATATASGSWGINTPITWSRLRIKRLTTNATNSLQIRLARGQ